MPMLLFITSKDGNDLIGVAPSNQFSEVANQWHSVIRDMAGQQPRLRWQGQTFRAIEGRFPSASDQTMSDTVLIWVPSAEDPVTALPGRSEFLLSMRESLREFERDRIERVLLFGDLDRFKHINDTYGHATGDAVLRIVARRLTHMVRAEDRVFRWGGDEFAIIARFPNMDVSEAERATTVLCRKLRAAIEQPIRIDTGNHVIYCHLGISFGYSWLREAADRFETIEQRIESLVSLADRRMYLEKRQRAH